MAGGREAVSAKRDQSRNQPQVHYVRNLTVTPVTKNDRENRVVVKLSLIEVP